MSAKPWKMPLKVFLFSLIPSLAFFSIFYFSALEALTPEGKVDTREGIWLILNFLLFLNFLFIIGSLLGMLSARRRRVSLLIFLACLTIYSSAKFWKAQAQQAKWFAYKALAERSQPLIQAIMAYQTKHGTPPDDLKDLVPEFISQIPGTGIGAAPDYEYHSNSHHMSSYGRNPWILQVDASNGLFDMCHFTYLPNQDYVNVTKMDPMVWKIERVGDWCFRYWYIP